MVKQAWKTMAIAASVAALMAHCAALGEEADVNAYIVKAPIAGLPSGPFGGWSEAERQVAFGRVRGFCEFLCVDKYKGERFPDKATVERTAAEAKVCLGSCIAAHLPPDYPHYAELTKQLHTDFDRARQLGSKMSWPLPGK
jgi:hypothetical protein